MTHRLLEQLFVCACEQITCAAVGAQREKAAERLGVQLYAIPTGSGPDGRILVEDVEALAAHRPAQAETRQRLSKMRRAIAKNLTISKQTVPHFYVRLTVDASGKISFPFTWPAHAPPGAQFYVQYWIVDAAASHGCSASNGLQVVGQ